jgi:hypothetical protein
MIPEELLHIGVACEAHDPLDAGPVVPAAVEQDHLTSCRQVGNITLEVPLCPLPFGRQWESHHARHPRVQSEGDRLDGSALAGGVAALEDDDDLEPTGADPFLELDELHLEHRELRPVLLAGERLLRRRGLDGRIRPDIGQPDFFRDG